MQLHLVQRALRRRLLQGGSRAFALNRRDPLKRVSDYAELDAMVDLLWADMAAAQPSASFAASSVFAA